MIVLYIFYILACIQQKGMFHLKIIETQFTWKFFKRQSSTWKLLTTSLLGSSSNDKQFHLKIIDKQFTGKFFKRYRVPLENYWHAVYWKVLQTVKISTWKLLTRSLLRSSSKDRVPLENYWRPVYWEVFQMTKSYTWKLLTRSLLGSSSNDKDFHLKIIDTQFTGKFFKRQRVPLPADNRHRSTTSP